MRPQIQETATTSSIAIDYAKGLRTQQREWTAKSLGIEVEKEAPPTKKDFKKTLKRISCRVRK